MAYITSVLPFLICPIAMGVMMWMMHRSQARPSTTVEAFHDSEQKRPLGATVYDCMRHCLNWKVLAALVVVGVGTWIIMPTLRGMIVPLLLILVCPTSLLFALRRTRQGSSATQRAGMPQSLQSTFVVDQTQPEPTLHE